MFPGISRFFSSTIAAEYWEVEENVCKKQIKYLLMTEFLSCYISFFLVFLICHCNHGWVINLAIKYFSSGNIFPRKVQNLQRYNLQKQPPRGIPWKRCSENMQHIYRRTPMPECDFDKNALQFYWNHTSAWVFCCKFASYFQNTFS